MLIRVKAQPDGWEDKVEKINDTHYAVETREPPVQGRANRAIAGLLAGYFKISVSRVKLIKGFKERNKIFEINL